VSGRRWTLAAAIAAGAAIAGAIVVMTGGDRGAESAATVVSAAPAPAPVAPPPLPVVSEPRPRLDAEPAEPEVVAVAAPRIEGVVFATEYARDMCACTDGACIDLVNERHGGRLGQARASRDARPISEQFRRAMACARRVRGS
jgi:hypothetical protein